ncbi:MAG: PstS family phosphate ABC transporter substrate-binding protein [bacterium]|nr:PstS family phosphate ABC transporter substrate-binding protein [bacterium]
MPIRYGIVALLMCLLAGLSACNKPASKSGETANQSGTSTPNEQEGEKFAGSIEIDGSSTVFPITEAVAEEFESSNPDVSITVGVSGTGGGFKRFVTGETAVQDASRPIKDKEDAEAKANGIDYLEVPVAFDGLTVVVSPENDWVDHLTVDELKKIWEPESKVKLWSEVRKGWPASAIKLYGPGTDSGTFDYFTEAINGESKASRSDYTASEDDNVLVQGVSGDKFSLGYFGYAYFEENQDKLKAVSIDGGAGPVVPSAETVSNGQYTPLSRPLFIYVNSKELARPEVKAFLDFYIQHAADLVGTTGYIPLPAEAYIAVKTHYEAGKTGSVFMGKKTVGLTIEEVLAAGE